MEPMTPEMQALKDRLRATWSAGDYGHFATYLEPGALAFLERLAVAPGTRMLDVACGAGQIAIPAARAGVRVTGIDLAPNLVEQARARARAEGVDAEFLEGDAEALPFGDGEFDLVVSLIGAMFAPRPDRVAAELTRVCRPGGRIAMANWTPDGFVGRMFAAVGRHAPPPTLMPSPVKWGDEATLRERLRDGIAGVEATRRTYPMRYPFPPADVVEFFREYYGPTNRAFAALDDAGRSALREELESLWAGSNLATDGTTHVEAEYLEVVAARA
ncbi:MAG TPA: class I SAM-dependent methyltransferase [Longimicrobiaceae bacterium]|jgi:SAM-dependent methyltransferase